MDGIGREKQIQDQKRANQKRNKKIWRFNNK